jgi:hypothetical protein
MKLRQLAIELSEEAIRCSTIDEGDITDSFYVSFKEKTDHKYRDQLDHFFTTNDLYNKEYDEYSLSWFTPVTTLLPNNVFSESKPEDVLRLCFSQEVASDEVDYNRLPEIAAVNIYAMPMWVKSFFVMKFPRVVMQHEGSHLLRGIFSGSTHKLNCCITLHDESFNLIIAKDNGVQFYSHFDYQSAEDVVYHFLFAMQQKEFLHESGAITLFEGIGCKANLAHDLIEKFKLIKDLQRFVVEHKPQLLQKYQTLCV